MLNRIVTLSLAACLLLLPGSGAHAQQAAPSNAAPAEVKLSEALLKRLNPELREKAGSLLTMSEAQQQRLLDSSDEDLRASITASLSSSKPEAADFLIALLEKEPSAKVRSSIIRSWRSQPHWRAHPLIYPTLSKIIASDPDTGVSLLAVETLRGIRTNEISKLLASRLETARRSGDQAAVKQLAAEQERWISIENATMLPSFLRASPPVFSLKAAGQPVRVVAFGDFGTGSEAQKQVAAAVMKYHRQTPFDFGITLGDNFYPVGMESPGDPRWATQWEQLYQPLGVKFYATLGNHDWGHPDSPAAEILYSDKSKTWRMPSPYYTFTAGPAQFFALDTNRISEAQLIWLKEELAKSQAKWKVAYGHHHVYSATRGDNAGLIGRLLPVLQAGGVDLYICGHDHNLQHVRPEGGVHFFVAGGGGAGTYELKDYERTIFKAQTHGFASLEVEVKQLKVRLVRADGAQVYEYTLEKQGRVATGR
jgi:tartrate-resistant acid phosphatase type 5